MPSSGLIGLIGLLGLFHSSDTVQKRHIRELRADTERFFHCSSEVHEDGGRRGDCRGFDSQDFDTNCFVNRHAGA